MTHLFQTIVMIMALMLAACANYSQVEQHRTEIDALYTVDPQIVWSEITSGKTRIWTVDGGALQELSFISGVEDGEAPFIVESRDEDKNPKFRKGMTFLEIQDLVADGLAITGVQQLKTKNLRPVHFGNHDGFRFEFECVTKEGLEKSGLVVGSVVKEQLYLIVYYGAHAHYFAKHREHVEKIIASIQTKL